MLDKYIPILYNKDTKNEGHKTKKDKLKKTLDKIKIAVYNKYIN
jgi:hypothetical protein